MSLDGASHIILRGLTVEFNFGDGIRVSEGEGNLIAGCTVRNVNHYAIVFDGGKNHTAQCNNLHHLGEIEPVYAAGINCGLTGGGGGGHHPAVGMYVAHNVIHDTPPTSACFAAA